MLALQNLTIRRGARTLIEQLSVVIHSGQRVGVIGRNGVGKSSLFAAIRGLLPIDGGSIDLPSRVVVTSVSQDTPALPQAAIEYALDGDETLRALEVRLADLEERVLHDHSTPVLEALSAAHDQMNAIGGHAARARAAQLLHGLGFLPEQQSNPVASFSGGWRMRLNLARALMRRADLLLLDEPTNHLDLDATLWLQEELARFSGTLLLVSHDREFLDAVCTHTLHVERERATLYAGNYSSFERQRAERLTQQAAALETQQRRIAHLKSFVDRFKTHASKARQAQSRLKALARMEAVAPVLAENEFSFTFRAPERANSPLLSIRNARAGYPGKPLLSGLKLVLNPGDRVALLGANGAGKSTLIKSLAGTQDWLGGEVMRDPYLKVGYYAQHQMERLDAKASALLHLRRMDPKASEQSLRDYLGQFAFHGDKQLDPIAPFSGGEKARLALALVAYTRPNLLLLDEPTNHLDLDMRQALEEALQDYPGAVVLVSHDRHLVESCCDALWRVADGVCEPYDGDLTDYARWLADRRRSAQKESAKERREQAAAPAPVTVVSTAPALTAAAPSREQREQIKKLEKQMEKLQARIAELDQTLADPALYADGKQAKLRTMTADKAKLVAELEAAENTWLGLMG